MPRLASLYLPHLAIERIWRRERARSGSAGRPRSLSSEGVSLHSPVTKLLAAEDDAARSTDCSCPRGGGWRPGARWAREAPAEAESFGTAEGALVTYVRAGNRDLLAAACPRARALGLLPGMPLAKARVLVRGLDVRPTDAQGDTAWLARLGLFAARRWTPRAAAFGPDGLWLDLTGVDHLFGGEERMCRRILAFVKRLGFTARIAVAGSAGAAHALARFGGKPLILCPQHGEADALAPMPLAALRLDEHVLGAAHRLGLERIGELLAMPRAPLQRRFGDTMLRRLDQALGRAAEPIEPIVSEQPPAIMLSFLEPIATAEAIAETTGEAVRRLVPQLREQGLGVRHLILACERVDNNVQSIAIGLARATRDGVHLHKLLVAKIEEIEPGFGIERLQLIAARVEPLPPEPIEGELRGEQPAPDLAILVDRLATRRGVRRVYRLSALESDLPERSVRAAGPLEDVLGWPGWPRPVRLLHPPEPVQHVLAPLPDGAPARFTWRGQAYRVCAADGPERVFGEWWRRANEREAVRDYFQVEEADGRRFWVFRKGDGVDPGTGDLSWWLQGIMG